MFKKISALLLALTLVFALTACTLTVNNNETPASSAAAAASSVEETAKVNITVTVTFPDETTKEFPIATEAEFLRGALEEANLVEGEESQYGLYVHKVDGVSDADGFYWAFYKDGEYLMTGVDTTPIADGDHFEIKYEAY
ncbi:MAG: DUF4430 domain-containing protein [Clostridia bacterium]|nr:DUF4430 domain-containing protein [Clostridia bacterium]